MGLGRLAPLRPMKAPGGLLIWRLARHAITESNEIADRTEPAEAKDPMDKSEPNDPTE
jgi:hypothetical protein